MDNHLQPKSHSLTLVASLMSTVFALSACGGGEPETIESKQAVAAETALWTSPTAWTTIATEGRSFSVSGTVTVRYGADSRWVSKSVTGSGNCTNTFFGKDPAYGVVKSCQVGDSASAPAPAPAPAPATTSSWSTIAGEGDPFSFSGTRTVRYGADTRWVQKVVTDNGQCTNTYFGNDPAYGVRKSCQVSSTAAPAPAPAPAPATDERRAGAD